MAQETCVSKEAKSKSFNKYKQWRKDGLPARTDKGEVIGGGWFVFKRSPKTGRISPSQFPFEYDCKTQAVGQAKILAKQYPGAEFAILQVHSNERVAS